VITASVIVSPRYASASVFIFCRIMAETSGGEYSLPPIQTRTSPFGAAVTLYGVNSMARLTSGSLNLRPMKRLIEKIVFSGFVIACRRATCPIMRSPLLGLIATTEGKRRPPSELVITVGSPPSITAHTELVVPKSIPMILLIATLLQS
jgi:hypothetical protein